MRSRPYRLAGVLSSLFLLVPAAAPLAVAEAADVPVPGAAAAPGTTPELPATTVTLLTGDRVTLSGRTGITVTPGAGRTGVAFAVTEERGRRYVVPTDARPLIASGRLDRRLFDVTGLVAFGYDDKSRADLPVLVKQSSGVRPAAALSAPGLRVVRGNLAGGRVASVVAAKASTTAFWERIKRADAGVTKVWLDGKRSLALDGSVAQIGAPAAWAAGYTGAGVKVAVLDSGIDAAHPDLAGQVVAARSFSAEPGTDDAVGHGTHVAATIASTGAGAGGRYRGVAPDVQLLNGKVCGARDCLDSAILAGMQWAVDEGARIVNVSLGSADAPGVDPLEEAINTLSAQRGTLFVVSAGNDGEFGEFTLGSPGTADAALTVGAVDDQDALAVFSSRGPRLGDGAIKPDITAPGVGIVAAKAANGSLGTPGPVPGYVAMSGTSMAAPHVAGAAALLAQQHPDWSGATLKAALMNSAKPTGAVSVYGQGAGRVDVERATTQVVTAQPASLSLGTQLWPHTGDTPIERKLTYTNTTATPITVSVAVNAVGPGGSPAPDGLFSVSPAQVTIPAHAEASVTVTARTTGASRPGRFEGTVVASSETVQVRTPLQLEVEGEVYEATVKFLDSAGQPTPAWMDIYRVDSAMLLPDLVAGESGVAKIRLPKGTYGISGAISTNAELSMMTYPKLVVDRDLSITIDAREAGPVAVTLPEEPSAVERLGGVIIDHLPAAGTGMRVMYIVQGGFSGHGRSVRLGKAGPAVPDGELAANIQSNWSASAAGATTATLYALGWDFPDQLPSGLSRAVMRAQLALEEFRLPTTADERMYFHPWLGSTDRAVDFQFAWPADVSGATTVRGYVTTGAEKARWRWQLRRFTANFEPIQAVWTPFTTYQAGTRNSSTAFTPVFGPTMVWVGDGNDMFRHRDRIYPGGAFLFGDGAGHRGYLPMSSYQTTLARLDKPGDIPLDASGTYPVPSEPGRYRLTASATRADADELSPRIDAAWEFSSAHEPAATGKPLPLSVVRFAPRLDAGGNAPAGRVFAVPLTTQRYRGGDAGPIRQVTAQVSYDEGATWAAAPATPQVILLRHPDGPASVSLRVRATDTKGNSFSLTTIRAYRTK